MLTTGNQLRAARALVDMDQGTLAGRAGVNINTISSMERRGTEVLTSGLDKVKAVMHVLEEAGVEFLNHGQPGVRLKSQSQDQVMALPLEPLQIVSSSDMSVRLRTHDGELPINVVVERSAIEDHLQLSGSTAEVRRQIIEANLAVVTAIATDRHRRRMWSEGQSNHGGRYRQIVIREQDLRGAVLRLPK
jgi:transcriptional regulator with XRE-family HTH domain